MTRGGAAWAAISGSRSEDEINGHKASTRPDEVGASLPLVGRLLSTESNRVCKCNLEQETFQ